MDVALLFAVAFWIGHPYASAAGLWWSYTSIAVAYALVVFFLGKLRKNEVEKVYVPPRVGG